MSSSSNRRWPTPEYSYLNNTEVDEADVLYFAFPPKIQLEKFPRGVYYERHATYVPPGTTDKKKYRRYGWVESPEALFDTIVSTKDQDHWSVFEVCPRSTLAKEPFFGQFAAKVKYFYDLDVPAEAIPLFNEKDFEDFRAELHSETIKLALEYKICVELEGFATYKAHIKGKKISYHGVHESFHFASIIHQGAFWKALYPRLKHPLAAYLDFVYTPNRVFRLPYCCKLGVSNYLVPGKNLKAYDGYPSRFDIEGAKYIVNKGLFLKGVITNIPEGAEECLFPPDAVLISPSDSATKFSKKRSEKPENITKFKSSLNPRQVVELTPDDELYIILPENLIHFLNLTCKDHTNDGPIGKNKFQYNLDLCWIARYYAPKNWREIMVEYYKGCTFDDPNVEEWTHLDRCGGASNWSRQYSPKLKKLLYYINENIKENPILKPELDQVKQDYLMINPPKPFNFHSDPLTYGKLEHMLDGATLTHEDIFGKVCLQLRRTIAKIRAHGKPVYITKGNGRCHVLPGFPVPSCGIKLKIIENKSVEVKDENGNVTKVTKPVAENRALAVVIEMCRKFIAFIDAEWIPYSPLKPPVLTIEPNFNYFFGYAAEKLMPVGDPDPEIIKGYRSLWHDFVFEGDTRAGNYAIGFWADMAQNPDRPYRSGIHLEGKSGCAKSTLIERQLKIFGDELTCITDNVTSLIGKFNMVGYRKIAALCNEFRLEDFKHDINTYKNFFTSPVMDYNEKYGTLKLQEKNRCRMLQTSNKSGIESLEPAVKKRLLYKLMNDKYSWEKCKGNAKLWEERKKILEYYFDYILAPENLGHILKYLLYIDNSKWDPEIDWVDENEVQVEQLEPHEEFLESWDWESATRGTITAPIQGKELWDEYCSWCKKKKSSAFHPLSFPMFLKKIPSCVERNTLIITTTINTHGKSCNLYYSPHIDTERLDSKNRAAKHSMLTQLKKKFDQGDFPLKTYQRIISDIDKAHLSATEKGKRLDNDIDEYLPRHPEEREVEAEIPKTEVNIDEVPEEQPPVEVPPATPRSNGKDSVGPSDVEPESSEPKPKKKKSKKEKHIKTTSEATPFAADDWRAMQEAYLKRHHAEDD